ncbi:P-loop containing nucleoside triphosphate hydrolase protein [Punctularia strigosozonata HHB-11173 SS5]|uniref:P-loop containing nucleoside triphosphate hydrolase protein n=1 Tax=Punctularia strigosozonata (strain HHB-11173) TaxID=741275 RepID=UPI000441653D|nr:P-loop containing nucleoside triphosphate hydrolase protein [Punctularia strigosozonata HHB-11173 SS5]EIN14507.1 P-loop containing nucleoside triphosphate hydrolase protein [Punctularia strigosozonata HHB-11173 SS5]
MTPSNDAELVAFIARQRELLARERQEEVNRSSLLLSNCSQKQLEHKGLAIGGLGVASLNIGLGGKTLVELERPTAYNASPLLPPHTLRPGDLARVEENVTGAGTASKFAKGRKPSTAPDKECKSTEGVVYQVSDSRIVIASDAEDVDLPERCRIVKLANSITYDRMDKAIDQMERVVLPSHGDKGYPSPPPNRLVQILLGLASPSPLRPIDHLTFFNEGLNSTQREAVKFVLQSPEVACIHGPPGTGKTHTLIEIIRQLTSITAWNPRPQRLLVCGASNLSVDNILERLLALPPPSDPKQGKIKVTRVGHPARVMAKEGVLEATLEVQAGRSDQAALAKDVKNELEATLDSLNGKGKGAKAKRPRGLERKKMWDDVRALRKEYRKREGGVVESVLKASEVVLATCFTSGGRQLFNQDFDVVIIDEATQAMEAVCWIPVFKAEKLILAGDPMQLPPTVLSLDEGMFAETKGIADKRTVKSTSKKMAYQQTDEGNEPSRRFNAVLPSLEPSERDDVIIESDSTEEKPLSSKIKRSKPLGRLQSPKSLEVTLFDRLEKMYGSNIKRMLRIQYRMHAHINAFPSKTLYSNKLIPHPTVANHLLRDLPNIATSENDLDLDALETPVVFFDTAGCEYHERTDGDGDEGSKCNENEASVVKHWVETLVGAGILPDQIAIVTPYQAQVQLLTSVLRPTFGSDLEIGSIDGMQGREKEAVIITLVRSNSKREVGFLKEKRRLNVAMTRAKRHLCVVGDSSTVQHGSSFLKAWMSWLEENADVRYPEI